VKEWKEGKNGDRNSNLDIDWRELYPIKRWRQTGGDYPEENREGNLES
jgi:hypothetical protein